MCELSKDGSVHVTDERFNTASHMIAAMLSLLGSAMLIVKAATGATVLHIISFSIYGLSLILLFIASALHHGINGSSRTEALFRIFDYLAIFPLIAGTYTPICLVVLQGSLGWTVFGVVWAIAILGITLKASIPGLPKWVTNTFYLTLGLMSVVLIPPLFSILPGAAIFLAVGGVFYVGGNVIFTRERPNPVPGLFGFHEIWHLFVMAGAFSHFIVMYHYILPFTKG